MLQEDGTEAYNATACCFAAGLSETCMPLCSYDASVKDVRALATMCAPHFHTLLRCGAGGRNHKVTYLIYMEKTFRPSYLVFIFIFLCFPYKIWM